MFISKSISYGRLSILGTEKLAPVKEKLGDDYTYEEIRLVRAHKMSNSNKQGA